MPSRKKPSQKSIKSASAIATPQQQQQQPQSCYEGERLDRLLQSIQRAIESQRVLDGRNPLPNNIWLKQQFSIGVNDVTRVLERMSPASSQQQQPVASHRLQAILLALDCNPRWLTKHIPSLAASRKVPIIFVKDSKAGSLRLGQLVNLKTALAIGVKVKGNAINETIEEILSIPTDGNEINVEEPSLVSLIEKPGAELMT